MPINSVSASNYKTSKPSFHGLTPVSYVVVDGHTETDKKLIDDVTKQFVKQIKEGKPEDAHLRQALHQATGDSSLAQAYQTIKKMGRYLITGQDAVDLESIWAGHKSTIKNKSQQASDFVKKLFKKVTPHKLAIVAEKTDVKGKVKYIVKNLYTTIY